MEKRGKGRPRNLKSPEELLELWEEYKAHIDNNPEIQKVVTGKGIIVDVPTRKPYLKAGFTTYVRSVKGF